jgi:hypothetical protein
MVVGCCKAVGLILRSCHPGPDLLLPHIMAGEDDRFASVVLVTRAGHEKGPRAGSQIGRAHV